jgi:hypothetical protein
MARPTMLIAFCLIATPALAQPANWLIGSWKLVQATQTENGQSRDYLACLIHDISSALIY